MKIKGKCWLIVSRVECDFTDIFVLQYNLCFLLSVYYTAN